MAYIEQFLGQKTLYKRQIEGFEKLRVKLGMGEQTPSDNACKAIMELTAKQK